MAMAGKGRMRSQRRVFWLLSGMLILLAIGAGLAAVALVNPGLSEFAGPPVQSPDGRFVAQVHESNCGTPCDFSVRVEIESAGQTTTALNGDMHPCTVILEWEAPDSLLIVYPPGFQVTEHQPGLPGLSVTFAQREISAGEMSATWGISSLGECYARYLQ